MIVRALAKVGIARFFKNPVGTTPRGFCFILACRRLGGRRDGGGACSNPWSFNGMHPSWPANSGASFLVLLLTIWCSFLPICVADVTLQQIEVAARETAAKLETDTLTWSTEVEIPGTRLL